MDLADLSSLSKYNEIYKGLLKVIDIFSSYVWSVSLKDKTGTYITSELKYFFAIGNQLLYTQIKVLSL